MARSTIAGPPLARCRHLVARAIGILVILGVLGACRVDTTVTMQVERDGSGTLSVTATADSDIVNESPGLAADLRTTDLTAAGWTVDGPAPTPDGGLTVTFSRPFASATEATALLAQLGGEGGPFSNLTLERSATRTRISTELSGTLLAPGPQTFSDSGLTATLGGVPYELLLQQRGLTLDQVLGITLSATLPGEVDESNGTAAPADQALHQTTITWVAALGGAAAAPPGQLLEARTVLDDSGARTAQRIREFAVWALPAWVVFFTFVVLPVVYLRRRRPGAPGEL